MPKGQPSAANAENYEYAFMLFMKRVPQKDICDRAHVSSTTLTKWKKEGGWEEKRAAKTVSIDALVTKTLRRIDEMLENPDFNADAFSKAVKQLKSLQQGATVDDKIIAYMNFGDWLIERMPEDREVDEEFVKKVTRYQDIYILKNLANGYR